MSNLETGVAGAASPASPSVIAKSTTPGAIARELAGGAPDGTDDCSASLELLKLKNGEAAALQGHIARTTALYFAVMGALFKFAFDVSSTPALRSVLSTVGVATSFVFCLAALFAQKYRKNLLLTLSALHKNLGLHAFHESLPGIKYSIILALAIALVVIATWIVVLTARIGA